MTASTLWILSGLAQPVPELGRMALVVLVAIGILLADFKVVRLSLPDPNRQVPRSIFERGRHFAAIQFGFELGSGVRTYISAGSPYLLALALLLLSPSYGVSMLAGACFGLGRALIVGLRWRVRRTDGWGCLLSERLRWLPSVSALLAAVILAGLIGVGA